METSTRIFLNRWFLSMLFIGALALTCSLLAVYVFHLKPCVICKIQRIPFALLIANATLGLIGPSKEGFFKMTQACLALGALLGITHFLMQRGTLPDFCTAYRDFDTPEEFLKVLQTSKCSDVAWAIFGVPVSLLNAMVHGSIFWVSLRLKRKRKLFRGAS